MARIRRRKQIKTTVLPDGQIMKLRLIPWFRVGPTCVWLASVGISPSVRQLNQWLNKRQTRRAKRLATRLTGKVGLKSHALLIRQLREWVAYIPVGDSITFRCESAKPDKQYAAWKRWLDLHFEVKWEPLEEYKSFIFHKSKEIE